MPVQLPIPYTLDIEGDVPLQYLPTLGAGYVAARAGGALVADANAFQAFLSQYENKTGIKFDEGIFGHEIFRRVFVETLAAAYAAYSSSRSQYLVKDRQVPKHDLARYTTLDDEMLLKYFFGNRTIDNLDELIENERKLLEVLKSIYQLRLQQQTRAQQNQGQAQQQDQGQT